MGKSSGKPLATIGCYGSIQRQNTKKPAVAKSTKPSTCAALVSTKPAAHKPPIVDDLTNNHCCYDFGMPLAILVPLIFASDILVLIQSRTHESPNNSSATTVSSTTTQPTGNTEGLDLISIIAGVYTAALILGGLFTAIRRTLRCDITTKASPARVAHGTAVALLHEIPTAIALPCVVLSVTEAVSKTNGAAAISVMVPLAFILALAVLGVESKQYRRSVYATRAPASEKEELIEGRQEIFHLNGPGIITAMVIFMSPITALNSLLNNPDTSYWAHLYHAMMTASVVLFAPNFSAAASALIANKGKCGRLENGEPANLCFQLTDKAKTVASILGAWRLIQVLSDNLFNGRFQPSESGKMVFAMLTAAILTTGCMLKHGASAGYHKTPTSQSQALLLSALSSGHPDQEADREQNNLDV